MAEASDLLKPTEAAVVSGVELSIVNKVIARALPPRLVRRGRGLSISAEACFYIAFYHESGSKLTADERRLAIQDIDSRVVATDDTAPRWGLLARHCTVQHEYLELNLKPFLTRTHERWDRYRAARKAVISDASILAGTPVIAGTRVPVHDVAASVAAGLPLSRILAAYPSLSEEQVELAALYARANPLQGRPPVRKASEGAKLRSRRVVSRRQVEA